MDVITISATKQHFDGKNYWCGSGRYYRRKVSEHQSELLHRAVWRHHHGVIPKGLHIHHKDMNWHNNQIGNLELKSSHEHLSEHMTPERRARQREWVEKIRPLASTWHKSAEAKIVHSKIGKDSWVGRELTKKNCSHCGKEYATPFPTRSRYCHQNCKMSARRRRLNGYPEHISKSRFTTLKYKERTASQ